MHHSNKARYFSSTISYFSYVLTEAETLMLVGIRVLDFHLR